MLALGSTSGPVWQNRAHVVGARRTRSMSVEQRRQSRPPPSEREVRPVGIVLFIYDGSVWPTSSGMNPTATIAALALRFAEHLVGNRRDQPVAD
jgi:hypothetical protein